MEHWQYWLAAAVTVGLALAVRSAVIKRRNRIERDFTRKLETVLQPKETVKVVCRDRNGRWILTSRRLLLDTKEGFLALPFGKIKSLRGVDAAGKATASAAKMASVTIKADREYTICNGCETFVELVRLLKSKTRKKKKKT